MPKDKKIVYFCQECGYESAKWLGQCPVCKAWNTFVEERITGSIKASPNAEHTAKVTKLSEVRMQDHTREKTGFGELDRVLGGGIVKGSLVLIGGDPGIGKSTLLLQVCKELAANGRKVLYISGEESPEQLKMRAQRVGKDADLLLLCETQLEAAEEAIRRVRADLVVIDSIQTMYSSEVASAPGSISQVREATGLLMRLAKGMDVPIFLVGHVTKEGVVAGPRVLEHMVDTVLYLEGDRYASYRILRGVKNRFGSTNELGVFEMKQEGLQEVANPSEFMISGRCKDASGSVISCAMEGTRCMLLEVQALTAKSNFGNPRRTAVGFDVNRLNLLMAVLEKRMGVNFSLYDAYINVAGGIRINEPAQDLAVALSLLSSLYDREIPADTAVFGEIGLSGEIRMVSMSQQRVSEAAKLGFTKCIMPKSALKNVKAPEGMQLYGMDTVRELKQILGQVKS